MYVINTNTNAMNSQMHGMLVSRDMDSTLEQLSSGRRLNKAADDSSGMAIADSLRTQGQALGQSIKNANDAIGIIQIADKAMDEQVKILDSIRTKAVQAAMDGQSLKSRQALQSDIVRLLEELDNIAMTTTYNGMSLLGGGFANKAFQIGAYSNEVIKASIGSTSSAKIGHSRYETGQPILESSTVALRFLKTDGINDIDLESVVISSSTGTGLGTLVEKINQHSDALQLKASATVKLTGKVPINSSTVTNEQNQIVGLRINGVELGNLIDIKEGDSDGLVQAAINNATSNTGVTASLTSNGSLVLSTVDNRGIMLEAESGLNILGVDVKTNEVPKGATQNDDGRKANSSEFYGRLTLARDQARDIVVQQKGSDDTYVAPSGIGFHTGTNADGTTFAPAETILNLRSIRGPFSVDQASAIGHHSSPYDENRLRAQASGKIPTGVTTHTGAQAVMRIAETAIKMLNQIRSDLGSAQIQLEATVNNITTTRTNVKFSESQIRDVDYSEAVSEFRTQNILGQAGNYALTQAHQVKQNVLKLLQ